MVRKITATLYTLISLIGAFVSPFFIDWYLGKLQVKELPVQVVIAMVILGMLQIIIFGYLWFRVFDKDLK